jgi:hypothetical protein
LPLEKAVNGGDLIGNPPPASVGRLQATFSTLTRQTEPGHLPVKGQSGSTGQNRPVVNHPK